MKFLIVATFKSNKLQEDVDAWVKQIAPLADPSQAQLVVAPSFVHLERVGSQISKTHHSSLALSAQDVSPFPPGSYTGAVNVDQLAELGVKFCLVGHSERRRYFHETHVEVANKVELLLGSNITPILCLSKEDIVPQMSALDKSLIDKTVFCFEPPGDIGGTETAPIEEIQSTLEFIEHTADQKVTLMYGGSVNADNLASLLGLPINGVLVSTASLQPDSFQKVIQKYDQETQ